MHALPSHGIEGVVLKGLRMRYQFGERRWLKHEHRSTSEGVVAGVAGMLSAPTSVILGRYDAVGRLRFLGGTVCGDPASGGRASVAAVAPPGLGLGSTSGESRFPIYGLYRS